jgi:hypothetical protein
MEYVKGTTIRPEVGPLDRGPGRICAQRGCKVRLSRYNQRDTCYAHWKLEYGRVRGVTTS